MSSILTALKKLENEKSGRSPDSLKIDSDILKTADVSQRYSPLTMIAVCLLIFAGGAAAAYYILKEPKVPPALPKAQPAMTAIIIPTPVASPPLKAERVPAEIAVVPAGREAGRKITQIPLQKEAAQKKVPKVIKNAAAKTVSETKVKPDNTPELVIKELSITAAVPKLRVNGIAFQNQSADSMAIVNGVPVANGSTIEGATIEKILKDKVLFKINGEKFEIQLGQAN